ncbi:invasion associated locus B family protein [Vannielia litorea]|uniref:Invasion protein IalB, involved in pathogenesis n=1 Tax=Vannielia litorea TaxID=1217970 RepID=A0A1N6F407_9RHOB|nr:invasion associated locus B family protein [Vannielia litorea]SIN90001.1 Invasion protein IalB, involved in pathogenesis [Vannielia litorea]
MRLGSRQGAAVRARFLAVCWLAGLAIGAPLHAAEQTFTDWRVDCPDDGRACTASTTSFAEDRTWLSTLRIQPGAAQADLPVQILVPPGVHLASGLFVAVPGLRLAEATYLTCTNQACDARVSISTRQLAGWKRARAARLRYRPSSTAPPIEFDVSLMGLTAALGAAAEASR